MVKAVLNDTKEVMAASAYCAGEYGLKDIYIGVPCRIGRKGIEGIVEIELSEAEKAALRSSAKAIKGAIELL
jgi:malate dehydrogenase